MDRATNSDGETPPLPIVVLAAGGSTRMGSAKQLLPLGGQSLLRRAATTAVATGCRPAVVVLGRDADAMRGELAGLDVVAVDNPDWELGMGGSIRAAMAAVPPDAAGVVVTLCDQPHVDAAALAMLIDAFHRAGRTVAARYAGTVGVPAVFGPAAFPALLALDPAAGAKRLLGGDDVVPVDLPAAAVDVDTPADYRRACGDEPEQARPLTLYPARVAALLLELCVDLGFCLPAADQRRLEAEPPTDIETFTDAVFAAERMDPSVRPRLRSQVRRRVGEHFRDARGV